NQRADLRQRTQHSDIACSWSCCIASSKLHVRQLSFPVRPTFELPLSALRWVPLLRRWTRWRCDGPKKMVMRVGPVYLAIIVLIAALLLIWSKFGQAAKALPLTLQVVAEDVLQGSDVSLRPSQ